MDPNANCSPENEDDLGDSWGVSSTGLWGDGPSLVLDTRHYRPPLRCVRSNMPVLQLTSLKLSSMPLAGKIIVALLLPIMIWGRPIVVNLGLSEEFQQRQRRHKRLGGWIALGGSVGFVVLTITLLMLPGGFAQVADLVLAPLLCLVLFILITGVVLLTVAYFPPLYVYRTIKGFVWLYGAHPDFLITLPPWTGIPKESPGA
jgi:hypothetical protein